MLFKFAMYEKLWVNDVTLRSDGTVTDGDDDDELLDPPQAMRASPTTMRAGTNLDNFMRLTSQFRSSCGLLPDGSGRECAGNAGPTQQPFQPTIIVPLGWFECQVWHLPVI